MPRCDMLTYWLLPCFTTIYSVDFATRPLHDQVFMLWMNVGAGLRSCLKIVDLAWNYAHFRHAVIVCP